MGFPAVLGRLRGGAGGPVEVIAALGHGRSYGIWSRLAFGVRALPGIVDCGLWEELDRRPPLPTVALVCDIGNDLVYGQPAERIAAWVETCLERLAHHEAEIVLTPLPLATLENLSTLRYHLIRSILFPGRRGSLQALLERARELDSRLRRIGDAFGARVIEPQASWYGLDPIHVRRRSRVQAWSQILTHQRLSRDGYQRGDALPFLGAAELHLFGIPLHIQQPVRTLDDGSTVALY